MLANQYARKVLFTCLVYTKYIKQLDYELEISITRSKLYLNALNRHLEKRQEAASSGHSSALLTIYHRIESSVANHRTRFVIKR